MALFIVRIELHLALSSDYDVLHRSMAQAGFHRKIRDGSTDYNLPTAEYSIESPANVFAIRDQAAQTAAVTGKAASVLAIEVKTIAWNLPVA